MPEFFLACVIRDVKFWNNYEFIFIGTQTHLPKKYFSSEFGHPILQMLETQHFNTRQEKSFLNVLISSGNFPANFSTGVRVPRPPFRRP